MQALWHLNSSVSKIQHDEEANSEGDCLVQARYSLISLGTERTIALGKVPPPLFESMKVPYMEGNFTFPVKYGYSLVGVVKEGPTQLLEKAVHLMHPHQDYCRVQATDLFLIPKAIPLKRATLASNMETAVNAVWDSQISLGDRVLVVGFGLIGSLVALLAKQLPGVEVQITETNELRKQKAQELKFAVINDLEKDRYDIAFHTSGTAQGLQTAIDAVGMEGRIVELSWYGDKTVELNLGTQFHTLRKKIVSSQVSSIPANKRHRWNYHRRKQTVFKLLENPIYDQLLDAEIPFFQTPQVFHQIRTGQWQPLTALVKY